MSLKYGLHTCFVFVFIFPSTLLAEDIWPELTHIRLESPDGDKCSFKLPARLKVDGNKVTIIDNGIHKINLEGKIKDSGKFSATGSYSGSGYGVYKMNVTGNLSTTEEKIGGWRIVRCRGKVIRLATQSPEYEELDDDAVREMCYKWTADKSKCDD